jgi:hypothetical protein
MKTMNKSKPPKLTGGAGGGTGRLEKAAAAGGKNPPAKLNK